MKGFLQVYTGNGKGKSTAAFGLAIRAAGASLKVNVIQFIKNKTSSEMASLHSLGIPVRQFGNGPLFGRSIQPEDIAQVQNGLKETLHVFTEKSIDMLILDEINTSYKCGLLTEQEIMETLSQRPSGMEVICTGRGAPQELMDMADLVTEMKEITHYYRAGVPSRKGIEF